MTAARIDFRRGLARLEYAVARGVAALFRSLPLEAASAAMGWLWRRIGPLTPRHGRALHHLALALPDLSDAERRRIVTGMWDNLGRVAGETLLLDRLVADAARIEVSAETVDVLRRAAAGGVLVSLHAGNWEIVARAAGIAGLAAAGVYKPLENPLTERWLHAIRAPLYPGGLLARSGVAARALVARLRGGQTIAMLADLRDSRGIQVPFFGRPAYANPFPAMAARMTGKPIIAGRTIRLPGARFRIEVAEIPVPVTDDRAADVRTATTALHACFEGWIRERPAEWMWIHRKWDTERSKRRARRACSGGGPSPEDRADDGD